jgi:hypothetical protein
MAPTCIKHTLNPKWVASVSPQISTALLTSACSVSLRGIDCSRQAFSMLLGGGRFRQLSQQHCRISRARQGEAQLQSQPLSWRYLRSCTEHRLYSNLVPPLLYYIYLGSLNDTQIARVPCRCVAPRGRNPPPPPSPFPLPHEIQRINCLLARD